MDAADEVWNRAAMAGGGPEAGEGDALLASVLGVHNRAMSGGLLDAVQHSTPADLAAAEAGLDWLRLDAAAAVVAMCDVRSRQARSMTTIERRWWGVAQLRDGTHGVKPSQHPVLVND